MTELEKATSSIENFNKAVNKKTDLEESLREDIEDAEEVARNSERDFHSAREWLRDNQNHLQNLKRELIKLEYESKKYRS